MKQCRTALDYFLKYSSWSDVCMNELLSLIKLTCLCEMRLSIFFFRHSNGTYLSVVNPKRCSCHQLLVWPNFKLIRNIRSEYMLLVSHGRAPVISCRVPQREALPIAPIQQICGLLVEQIG